MKKHLAGSFDNPVKVMPKTTWRGKRWLLTTSGTSSRSGGAFRKASRRRGFKEEKVERRCCDQKGRSMRKEERVWKEEHEERGSMRMLPWIRVPTLVMAAGRHEPLMGLMPLQLPPCSQPHCQQLQPPLLQPHPLQGGGCTTLPPDH